MSFPTTGIIDDFNRADDPTPEGSSCSDGIHVWSATSINGTGQGANLVGNLMHLVAGTGDLYITADFGPDCEAYYDLPSAPSSGEYCFLAARIQDAGTSGWDGYGLIWINGAGWQVRRYDNGSSTVLSGTVPGNDLVSGDSFGIEVIGDTIRGLRKTGGSWIEVVSSTDSTYATAGKIGWEISSGELDNFGGGTVVVSGVTSPIGFLSGVGF